MGFFSMIYAVFMRFSCCFPASKITFSRMDFNGFPFSLKCSLIIILLFPMTKYWSWEVAFCSIKSSLFRGIPKWVTVCLRVSLVGESLLYSFNQTAFCPIHPDSKILVCILAFLVRQKVTAHSAA